MKLHLVFHILFLESVDSNMSVQNKSLELLSEYKYEIKRIVNYNILTDQYLVK